MLFLNQDGDLDVCPPSEGQALANLALVRDNGELLYARLLADAVLWLRANP